MVDLVAEHEPEKLHLRDVADRAGTGEELHGAAEVLVARPLQRLHHLGVSLEKGADGLLPLLRRLREPATEIELIPEGEENESLLDGEGPHELPRRIRARMRLELRLIRGERLDDAPRRTMLSLERLHELLLRARDRHRANGWGRGGSGHHCLCR